MNIFNSLGSNYNFDFVLKALFANNSETHKQRLISFLEKRYEGRAILVYKGREAIGLALNILKLSQMSSRGAKGDVAIPSEEIASQASPDRNDTPQVAINGFTCFAVYKAITNEGYDAQLLDLPNSSDLNFSAETLQIALKHNPKIKVVIIQNTLGYPCDIEKIAKICKENNLILIEDLAHSVGTTYKNSKEAGTVGDFVVLSFSQDKVIDTVSGGALIIRNKKFHYFYSSSERSESRSLKENSSRQDGYRTVTRQARTISKKQQLLDRLYPLFTFIIRKTYPMGIGKIIHFFLKSFNLLSKPTNESFYEKYSLPNCYCSLVLHAFEDLEKNLEHRKKIANIYNSMLDRKITFGCINKSITLSSNLRYPIFVEDRKSLISSLKKEGVYISDIWYDSVDETLKNAKIASKTILNLPTHLNVSEQDAKKIAQKINHFILRAKSREKSRDDSRSFATNSSRLSASGRIARTINSKEEWESFLAKNPEANFLQSWFWGELHKNLNNDIQRTGFYEGNKLVGVMLSVVENAKRGRYLTVPGGPIIDWKNTNLVSAFVIEIKRVAKEKSCVFARVRPQLESSDFSKKLFKKHGFIDAPMHLHAELTSQLDITKDEQTLLSQMRKTTRYEIKKAIKQGIKVTAYSSSDPSADGESRSSRPFDPFDPSASSGLRAGELRARTIDSSDSLIKKFYELQLETAKRQKFVPFSFKFLYEQFKVFADTKHALLYSAEFNNKLLAQAFIIFYGQEAVYHYGASTEEGRGYPGAYLIQWEAIKEAKKRGMTRYNFWGVSPIDKPDHRFSGLSLFKRGFGGQDVAYLPAQDLVVNLPKYMINFAVESIRKRIRNM